MESVALTPGVERDLDVSADPVAAVMAMCQRGADALGRAATIAEAKKCLGAASILEHAVKVRDLSGAAEVAATTLRLRAERRVGELLLERERNKGGRPPTKGVTERNEFQAPTLAAQGLDRVTAWRFRKLALAATVKFEHALDEVTKRALATKSTPTREAVLRQLSPSSAHTPSSVERFTEICTRVTKLAEKVVDGIRCGAIPIGHEDPDPVSRAHVALMVEAMVRANAAIDRVIRAIKMTSLAADVDGTQLTAKPDPEQRSGE
jgi:hypothetical protein